MAAPICIINPEEGIVKIVKWKVKKDSMVLKGSIMGLYETAQTKSLLKLKSSATGIVDKIMFEAGMECKPGNVLVTLREQESGGCTHPTVMKDMCADCGADLRREPGIAGDRREKMTASVAMVHNIPELIVSQEQALELGREDEQRLLKTRKLVLLVDLDQTLIHTTNDNIPAHLKDVYHFQMWQGPQAPWYHTKLRPYTHTFLQHVSKMYELHICTFGVRLYAHTVARLMDPDEKFFSHRILSRDECFDPLSKTANLKALFPCGDAMVCIIDDREDVWNRAPNLVHVKPYRFFQGTADINAPPGLEKSENDDVPIVHKVIDHHSDTSKPDTGADKQQCNEKAVSGSEGSPLTNTSGETQNSVKEEAMKDGGDKQNITVEIHNAETTQSSSIGKPDGEKTDTKKPDGEKSDEGIADGGKANEETKRSEKDSVREDRSCLKKNTEEGLEDDLCMSSDSASNSGDESDSENSESGDEKTMKAPVTAVIPMDIKSDPDSNGTAPTSLSHGQEDVGDSNLRRSVSMETGGFTENDSTQDNKISPDVTSAEDHKPKDSKSQSNSTQLEEKNKIEKGEQMQNETSNTPQVELDNKNGQMETEEGVRTSEEKTEPSSVSVSQQKCEKEASKEADEVEWDDDDDYLLHLEEILTRIHKAFYSMVDEGYRPSPTPTSTSPEEGSVLKKGNLPDLKSLIPYIKRKTLKGCNIVFSGVVPLNTPPEKSQAYMVARALGATVQQDLTLPRENDKKRHVTTHLVAAKPGTNKHKTALRMRGVHIVKIGWLWACNERWERCSENLFSLGSDVNESQPSPASQRHEKKERHRHAKRKSSPGHELDRSKASPDKRGRKRARSNKQESGDNTESSNDGQQSAEGMAQSDQDNDSGRFSDTVPPLLAFSDEDLECMDKEVDELMAEDVSGSEDEHDDDRDRRYRDTVLGNVDESSSSDSLSGEFPRGWGLRRKSSPHASDDDLEKQKHEEIEIETEDTENELTRFQKTVEAFSPDSDSNSSSFADSIGSVDDEIAEAVEKEFLGSM